MHARWNYMLTLAALIAVAMSGQLAAEGPTAFDQADAMRAGEPRVIHLAQLRSETALSDQVDQDWIAAKGWTPEQAGKLKKMLDSSQKAAETGDPDAQYRHSHFFGSDSFIPSNRAEQIKWLKKAANQGHADAQNSLALMYGSSFYKEIKQDYVESVKWNRLLAEQGDPRGLSGLGMAYWSGDGVRKDNVEAMKWIMLAVNAGDETAHIVRSALNREMSHAQITEAQNRAREWVQKKDR